MPSNIINIWLGALVFFNTFLALFIYYKNRKSRASIFYSLAVMSSTLWTAGTLVFRLADGPMLNAASIFLWAATVPIVYFFLYFSLNFPQPIRLKRELHVIILLPSLFVLLYLVLYVGLFSEIRNINGYRGFVYNLPAFIPYSLYIVSYFSASFIILLAKYLKQKGLVKTQLSFVIVGTLFSSTAGVVFGLILTFLGNFRFYWMSSGFTFIMTGCIAYAIIRHRLMDIRFVLRKYSVYLSALLSVIAPIVLIKFLFNNLLFEQTVLVDYLLIILAIIIYAPLRDYYFYIANRYFFTSLYDAREVIAKLSDRLSSTLFVYKIYQYISDSLLAALHVKTIGVFIYNEKTKKYENRYGYGEETRYEKSFIEDRGFYTAHLKRNQVILIDEIKKEAYVRHKNTFDLLTGYGIKLIVPLSVKDKVIGILTLGAKETGEIYNNEDIQLLEIVAAQAAIAIENALHYEEIRNFSKKLQWEVEKATEELIRANSRLRQLDQAKSEFVSIASHQLRTPLTVIKGYISMIREGNFGKVSPKFVKPLEMVYESNERLIQLVENLLNISRIESGRLRFNFEMIQIEDILASVANELSSPAEKRGLKIIFERPPTPLPKTLLDREKIRQVILNLIDNAIKYGKQGNINVTVGREHDYILVSVSDNGIGIRSDDLADMFEKFTRGTGTQLLDTEGTGLGLYVADQMIKAHKGRIWAESAGENKGSVFSFTLPIKQKLEFGEPDKRTKEKVLQTQMKS